MNLAAQNWYNLFGELTTDGIAWHGFWTTYSPDGEVIKYYEGERKFWANEDGTLIDQNNNYTYPNGSTERKKWQIDQQTCNQSDGVIHPAYTSLRVLSFGAGANAWVKKEFIVEQFFGCEFFFRHQDWRTSVAIIYGKDSTIEKIIQICEHKDSLPDHPPTAEIKNIPGNWIGKKQLMTADLKISQESEETQIELNSTNDQIQTIFLPDRIVLNIPQKLHVGEEIEITAGKLVTNNKYQQMTAKYNQNGKFQQLIYKDLTQKN